MGRKIGWLLVSSVTVAALLLAACAPATTTQSPTTTQQPTTTTTTTTTAPTTQAPTTTPTTTPTTGKEEMVKVTLTKLDGTVMEKSVEKPRYGGVFVGVWTADPPRFTHEYGQNTIFGYASALYNNALDRGNWARGPEGTGEFIFAEHTGISPDYLYTGSLNGLAESVEFPTPDTIIWHLRKGVHFALNPESAASRLVNGREFTADDIISSWNRYWDFPASYLPTVIVRSQVKEASAPDKYTVKIVFDLEKGGRLGWGWQIMGTFIVPLAHEVWETYGDARDWRNQVGTGPFILTDYITGSEATFNRNRDYFGRDPIHPENQLPYIDGVRFVIIPDAASRYAALRTAKVDWVNNVPYQDAKSLWQTNPELQYVRFLGVEDAIWLRVDKPQYPWYDVKVRQALMMAIDQAGLKRDYYGGEAEILMFPAVPDSFFKDIGTYRPMEELPPDVQELFSYNPTKAKQMLADAGYPNGFKMDLIASATQTDAAQLFAAYLAAVGVTVNIQLKEYAVWNSMYETRSYEQTVLGTASGGQAHSLLNVMPGDWHNKSFWDDPQIGEAALEMDRLFFDWKAKSKIMWDITPTILRAATGLTLPGPYTYRFWQPWVKGYHGELTVGNSVADFQTYLWIDQDLKKAMTK